MMTDSVDTFSIGDAFDDTSSVELRDRFVKWVTAYKKQIEIYKVNETNNYNKLVEISAKDGSIKGLQFVLEHAINPRPIFSMPKSFKNEIEFVESLPFTRDGVYLRGSAHTQEKFSRLGYIKAINDCLDTLKKFSRIV